MALWQLLNSPQTTPFAIALAIMGLLFVLELIAFMIGGGNDWVDGFLPDSLTEAHAEIGIDNVDAGIAIRFLSWLYVGKVPLLMLLVLFLAIFGLTGFVLQSLVFSVVGVYLPMLVAVMIVWFLSLPLLRLSAKGLYKILPRDETSAIEISELIGRVGVVTLGTATHNQSAQIRVKDTHGQTHYVMAFSDTEDVLNQGDTVLLVSQTGMNFRAIKNMNESLVS